MTYQDLSKINGIDSAKATTFLAAFELSKRALEVNDANLPLISNAKNAVAQLSDIRDLKKEHLVVLYLNIKNQLVHKETISMGVSHVSEPVQITAGYNYNEEFKTLLTIRSNNQTVFLPNWMLPIK
jgi:DNA repair protein RadC